MQDNPQLWTLEKRFWIEGAKFYQTHLASDALMVLPDPIGFMDRDAVVRSMQSATRWTRISFSHQSLISPVPHVAILAYEAQADRGTTDSTYSARCSSTYVLADNCWRLAVHHQSPRR